MQTATSIFSATTEPNEIKTSPIDLVRRDDANDIFYCCSITPAFRYFHLTLWPIFSTDWIQSIIDHSSATNWHSATNRHSATNQTHFFWSISGEDTAHCDNPSKEVQTRTLLLDKIKPNPANQPTKQKWSGGDGNYQFQLQLPTAAALCTVENLSPS